MSVHTDDPVQTPRGLQPADTLSFAQPRLGGLQEHAASQEQSTHVRREPPVASPQVPLLAPEGPLEHSHVPAQRMQPRRGTPSSQRRAQVKDSQAKNNWRDKLVLDTLQLMIRHKVVVILLVALTTLSGGASTLLVPPYYTARASIFPPPSDNPLGSFGMAGVAGLVGSLGLGGTGATQFHLYHEFATSRTLIMQVLEMPLRDVGFNGTLMQYLQIEEPDTNLRNEMAVESIRMRVLFEVDKQTGVVSIGFTDVSPKVAAAVVNEIIKLLDRFDSQVTASRARDRRQFIEVRMAEASVDLNRAETAFETFRENNLRIGNAPSLILEQARLQRDVEFEQQIYLTLRKEYELARIEEERSVPIVNVLDLATPPALKAGPSLLRNAATGGLMGVMLVIGLFLSMTLQPLRRLRQWGILGTPSRS